MTDSKLKKSYIKMTLYPILRVFIVGVILILDTSCSRRREVCYIVNPNHDCGIIQPDSTGRCEYSHDFVLKNSSEHVLSVDHLVTSCSCVSAECTIGPIAPHTCKIITVSASFDASKLCRRDHVAVVMSNLAIQPIDLTVTAYSSLGQRLEPPAIEFLNLLSSDLVEREVTVLLQTTNPTLAKTFRPKLTSSAMFTLVSSKIVGPTRYKVNGESLYTYAAKVCISCRATPSLVSDLDSKLQIYLSDGWTSSIPVKVNIAPDFVCYPPFFNLGRCAIGKTATLPFKITKMHKAAHICSVDVVGDAYSLSNVSLINDTVEGIIHLVKYSTAEAHGKLVLTLSDLTRTEFPLSAFVILPSNN